MNPRIETKKELLSNKKAVCLIAIFVFAVLMFLIIFGPDWNYRIIGEDKKSALDSISNSLNGIKSGGGETNSQNFSLTNGDFLSSTMLSSIDMDPRSVVFDFDSNSLPSSENTDKFVAIIDQNKSSSSVTYNGATRITVSARVICDTTGAMLKATMATITSITLANNIDPTALCGTDEFQPCCIVIIKKASN